MKRILSIVLAAMLLVATMAVAMPTSAAEVADEATGAGFIKFDASKWNNVKSVYAHIWVNGKDSFFPWGASENTACENVVGSIWQYDLSKLSNSTTVSGGFASGKDYCVIFHADTKVQTYDLTFGTECVGDIAIVTGNMVENPVDSEKEGYEAVWKNNASKYGPHRAITSIGNFVGKKLCPNEKATVVLGDWIVTYPATSQYCKPEEVLAKAMQEFKVKDIDAISAYVRTKEDIGLASVDEVDKYLSKAYKIAYPNETEKVVNTENVDNLVNKIEDGADIEDITSDNEPSENAPVSSTTNKDVSGSDKDGENDVILFILAGVMLLAAGVFVTTRRRED